MSNNGPVSPQPDRTAELTDALQRRVDAVYRELAEDAWMSPWYLFDGEDVAGLADDLRTDRTAPTE